MYYESGTSVWQIFHSDGSGISFGASAGAGTIISTGFGGEITDTRWHHIAMVKEGSESSVGARYGIWKDGVQVTYVEDDSIHNYGPTAQLIIGSAFSGDYFDGDVDAMVIINSNIFSAAGAPGPGFGPDIVVPTESPALGATSGNIILISTFASTTGAAPDTIKDYIDLEDISPTVILNIDVTVEGTRDGGTTWTSGTLAQTGQATQGRRLVEASVDVSGQPDPGIDLATTGYRVSTFNDIQMRLHANTRVWG